MSRVKKTSVGAINITMQPHSPRKYAELFKEAHKLRTPIRVRGDTFGILSGARSLGSDSNNIDIITGDIFRFTNIDPNANWFNTSTFDFADDDELGGIRVPDNLKPNSSRFSYILDTKSHYLFYEAYFDGKTLGSTGAQVFFDRLLNQPHLTDKYGVVEVTHIPKVDILDEAISIPFKEKIEYTISRPNPDDLGAAEREVLRRMSERNISKTHEVLTAIPGQSIEMDEELTLRAKIAAKNGEVYIKGKDYESRPTSFSTREHPYTVIDYFDSGAETAFIAMQRVSSMMKDQITEWFRS